LNVMTATQKTKTENSTMHLCSKHNTCARHTNTKYTYARTDNGTIDLYRLLFGKLDVNVTLCIATDCNANKSKLDLGFFYEVV